MNTRKCTFSVVLALVLIACFLPPCMQEKVLAAEQTFTFADEESYEALKKGLNFVSNGGGVAFNDTTKEITVDFQSISEFSIESLRRIDLSQEAQEFINKLFEEAFNLKTVKFKRVTLGNIDFTKLDNKMLDTLVINECGLTSVPDICLPDLRSLRLMNNDFSGAGSCAALKDSNFPGLSTLALDRCKLTDIPDITLSYLKYLYLSNNDFSANGALLNLDIAHFPALAGLYLDECKISKIGELSGLGSQLAVLSLGGNRLTDDALDALVSMKDRFPDLQEFDIGSRVHLGDNTINSGDVNTNKITDTKKLVSLLTEFPNLKRMDLSALGITSLQDFSGIGDDIGIDFSRNNIIDFAGFESNSNITLGRQYVTIPGYYVPGQESELPELLKRILDTNDVLNGSLEYNNCKLSDDGTKLSINPNVGGAYIEVKSGKLTGSRITVNMKKIPSYAIPQNLTAVVGDTLANVTLPAGFTWKNAAQDVGAEGTNTFAAVYTPQDTDKYAIVDVNIPVRVTDPNKPTEPATDPTKPTEPATDPTEPTKPTEPATDPTEPSKPTEPATKPDKPTEPVTEPTKPVVPTEPATEPNNPVVPTEAASEEYDEAEEDETGAAAVAAKTSDTSPVIPVMVLLLVSGMVLCITVSDKKKSVR